MLLKMSGELNPERIKRQDQRKKKKSQKHAVVDVTGDGSKV